MKVELIETPRKDFKPISIMLTIENRAELNALNVISNSGFAVPCYAERHGANPEVAARLLEEIYKKVKLL